MITEILRKTKRKSYSVTLDGNDFVVSVWKTVNGELFRGLEKYPMRMLLNSGSPRALIANLLWKLRRDLRIAIRTRNPYLIVSIKYFMANEYASQILRVPKSCWKYVGNLDSLIGLERGREIFIVNGIADSFFNQLYEYAAAREFKLKYVRY